MWKKDIRCVNANCSPTQTSSYLTCCSCSSDPNTLTRCLEGSPAKGAGMATWVMLRINLRIVPFSTTKKCEGWGLNRQGGTLHWATSLYGRVLSKVPFILIKTTYVNGRHETEFKDISSLLRLQCLKLNLISWAEPNMSIALANVV